MELFVRRFENRPGLWQGRIECYFPSSNHAKHRQLAPLMPCSQADP